MLSSEICQKARLSRDARFDGKFFTAVKTTGIYCRTICPVHPPKEENVTYYKSAIEAANDGYRPCLRCRPDSAPGSPAWKGVSTTLERAVKLIDAGALRENSLEHLADKLGITDRYLRQLFKKHLGISPKAYALYQQCLFAKQLLHQTSMPIVQVALASGFDSVRRFNDCFKSQLKLTPTQMRKSGKAVQSKLTMQLYYRPPYDWEKMQRFYANRIIPSLEWCDDDSYGRTIDWNGTSGSFTARHVAAKNKFEVTLDLDDLTHLKPILGNLRRILDLDVDITAVEQDLRRHTEGCFELSSGLRLPGIWSPFEAGIRAILGQQVSVVAARELVSKFVNALGITVADKKLFPTPAAVAASELDFLKMPGARKQTLRNLAQHFLDDENADNPETWLILKGIGPWTCDYAKLRGLSEPDIYLGGDLGVKKAFEKYAPILNPHDASPWRSYLTLHLWDQQ